MEGGKINFQLHYPLEVLRPARTVLMVRPQTTQADQSSKTKPNISTLKKERSVSTNGDKKSRECPKKTCHVVGKAELPVERSNEWIQYEER